jgi:N-acetylglucosamine kinase-like BadF-type ATPase
MIASDTEKRFDLFDYRDDRGRNEISAWTRGQEKRQIAQLNLKLDMLQRYGDEVSSNVLLRMSEHIYKLKAKTKQKQLRPMLCKGPIADATEFTLLVGAVEISWKLYPSDAVERAEARRLEIIANPTKRCPHERIDGKT